MRTRCAGRTSLPVFSVVSLFSYFYGARQRPLVVRRRRRTRRRSRASSLRNKRWRPASCRHRAATNLRADAHHRVQISCERALASVRELVSETLADAARRT